MYLRNLHMAVKGNRYICKLPLVSHVATTLGARYMDEKVFPYSFPEYLEATGLELEDHWEYGRQRNEVQKRFAEYFKWGGFPELLLFRNKRHWLIM